MFKKTGLFMLIILMVLSSAFIAACDDDDDDESDTGIISQPAGTVAQEDNTGNASQATEEPKEKITINALMGSGAEEMLKDVLPKFEAETGIKVNITGLGMTDLYAKLDTEFAAGSNTFDVAYMMWAAAQGYARAGYLHELDDMMEAIDLDVSQYASVYIDNHMIQYPETPAGKYICLPYTADCQILAYQQDLFEDPAEQAAFEAQYGYALAPPETFEQFVDMARFFTRPENDLYGTVVMGKNFPSLVGDITPYLRGFGGDWIDDTYHPVINCEESVTAIQYYYDLFASEEVTPPGSSTYSWDEEVADFQHGKIAMMVIWPGQAAGLENAEVSEVAGRIGYSVVPGKAPTVGGWALTIPEKSKKKEAAFKFISWLTSSETLLGLAQEGGYFTATQVLYSDPIMNEKFVYLKAVEASLPYGKGWPQIGEFTSIWQIGAEELSRVFAGELSAQEAADNMQERLEKLMKDGGYY